MQNYQPVKAEQYETLMTLMAAQTGYLDTTLKLMEMTLEEFSRLFRTVGQVFCIYKDEQLAGFYWIEARGAILHLHGLILEDAFQGKGIGSRVLADLEAGCSPGTTTIELGVHGSNTGAQRLYRRNGYQVVKSYDDLDFLVMQKRIKTRKESA